jgi:ankyrin repeat protein
VSRYERVWSHGLPLVNTSDMGLISAVRELLERGSDPIEVGAFMNINQETALQREVFRGYKDIALLLLNAGANANAKNKTGRSPLQCVSTTSFAKLLLTHGAHIDMREEKDLVEAGARIECPLLLPAEMMSIDHFTCS